MQIMNAPGFEMSTVVIPGTTNLTYGMPLYPEVGGSRLHSQRENDPPYIIGLSPIIKEPDYFGPYIEDSEQATDEDIHHR